MEEPRWWRMHREQVIFATGVLWSLGVGILLLIRY
jgi:hypothetical protein